MRRDEDFLADKPRLAHVIDVLTGEFKWGKRHRHTADMESKRNEFNAMCCRCEWQREYPTSRGASDEAMRHGRQAHGDEFAGFVRVVAR